MQLNLVDDTGSKEAQSAECAARLGLRLYEAVPVGDPAWIARVESAERTEPAHHTAAALLAKTFARESLLTPALFDSMQWALAYAHRADRLLDELPADATTILAMDESLERAERLLLGSSARHPKTQARQIAQATAPLVELRSRCQACDLRAA
jgi:hypothetical protein